MKKKYESPKHPWERTRIEREAEIRRKYGLRTKREIWRAETILRRFRREARRLQAMLGEAAEREKKQLIDKLVSLKLLEENAALDDVLSLTLEDILERRLQTVVYRKGLASTPKQARQFIVHGHIVVKGRKVTVPSYMVKADEEGLIGHRKGSTVSQIVAARPAEAGSEVEA